MGDRTAKRSSRGENDRIKYGASCMQGAHDAMQDAPTAILELNGLGSTSLFGVFDDHGGEGTTACVALVRGNQITLGNSGNSRCVLSRNGQAIDLSTYHKPDNPAKRARIEAAGGTVFRQEDMVDRDGKIAISRALGDFIYKQNDRLTADLQKMACSPEIRTENIPDNTEFLLIGSEGIWHTKSSAEVVAFVHRYLQSGETDLLLICEKVIDWCMESGNNSTVILVQFKSKTIDIPEEIWYEILLHLPSKMIMRCRAVCKAWRGITTTLKFLQQHHGLQKPQSLIVPVDNSGNMRSCVHRVLAIDLQLPEDQFRPIVSSTTFGRYKACDNEDEEKGVVSAVHASLDGMLLVSFDTTCYIINPATRKSSRIPALDSVKKVLGLYKHGSSGEYRVLYERASDSEEEDGGDSEEEDGGDSEEEDGGDSAEEDVEGGNLEEEELDSFCIIALGSQLTRSVMSLTPFECGKLHFIMDGQPPAVIGDILYWPPSELLNLITVFDTESEVFNWMDSPVKNKSDSVIKLIELHGYLAASVSSRGTSKVELYKLVDPHSKTWAHHHVIELPVAKIDRFWAGRFESFFVSLNGDILVECVWRSWDHKKKSPGKLLCCNENAEMRSLFQGYWRASPIHVLKESLIPQSFLSNTDPALFEGL